MLGRQQHASAQAGVGGTARCRLTLGWGGGSSNRAPLLRAVPPQRSDQGLPGAGAVLLQTGSQPRAPTHGAPACTALVPLSGAPHLTVTQGKAESP